MTPALATDALAVHGPDGPLVRPITLAAAPGTALTILGETGAGKSLLAQAILGALPPGLAATGSVFLDGQRLDTLAAAPRRALWGRRIAMPLNIFPSQAPPRPPASFPKHMDRPMRTPDPQPRDQDERDRHLPMPDRQALIELLAAREQAPETEADLAWIADRFELRR